jgi:hypothetical protein
MKGFAQKSLQYWQNKETISAVGWLRSSPYILIQIMEIKPVSSSSSSTYIFNRCTIQWEVGDRRISLQSFFTFCQARSCNIYIHIFTVWIRKQALGLYSSGNSGKTLKLVQWNFFCHCWQDRDNGGESENFTGHHFSMTRWSTSRASLKSWCPPIPPWKYSPYPISSSSSFFSENQRSRSY